jgi:hypothetical protein
LQIEFHFILKLKSIVHDDHNHYDKTNGGVDVGVMKMMMNSKTTTKKKTKTTTAN